MIEVESARARLAEIKAGNRDPNLLEGDFDWLCDQLSGFLNGKTVKQLADYSGWSPHQFNALLKEHHELQQKHIELDSRRYAAEQAVAAARERAKALCDALEWHVRIYNGHPDLKLKCQALRELLPQEGK